MTGIEALDIATEFAKQAQYGIRPPAFPLSRRMPMASSLGFLLGAATRRRMLGPQYQPTTPTPAEVPAMRQPAVERKREQPIYR